MHRSKLLIISSLWFMSAHAVDSDTQKITEKLKTIFPNTEVTSIAPAKIAGLYEVVLDTDVLYMTADGQYAVKGDLWDLNSRRNLSEERRGESRLTALKAIKREDVIEFAPKDTKHFIYVFTDVDCGYCRKFHQEVNELNTAGVAVRYLAFPRAGIDSDTYKKMVSVWCAKDRNSALTDAKNDKELAPGNCKTPINEQYELGQKMGVQGTPTIFLDDGRELGGYVPAAQLVQYLKGEKIN